MRAPEALPALRLVASPTTLDGLAWPEGVTALRLASDDLLLIGEGKVALGSESAIIEQDAGFVGWWLTPPELETAVLPHVDWPLPQTRPALAQGLIAGVPARIWLADDRALLLCAAAYAHELAERLG